MTEDTKDRVLDAALVHVPFDGWSDRTLRAALADAGVPLGLGKALFPRGGVDLALAYHARGDAQMVARLAETDLAALRFRDRIAKAVQILSLPQHAADGAKAVWGTADRIWTALGDTSDDVNWYTKRATLSAVYGATVLYWLGDTSPGHQATWEFLDRRIDGVMQIEKLKAAVKENPLGKAILAGPGKVLETLRKPRLPDNLPGRHEG
jgi:ubiquinone biosynthesis protein COQ9